MIFKTSFFRKYVPFSRISFRFSKNSRIFHPVFRNSIDYPRIFAKIIFRSGKFRNNNARARNNIAHAHARAFVYTLAHSIHTVYYRVRVRVRARKFDRTHSSARKFRSDHPRFNFGKQENVFHFSKIRSHFPEIASAFSEIPAHQVGIFRKMHLDLAFRKMDSHLVREDFSRTLVREISSRMRSSFFRNP